jgi:hypothetical protein
VTFKPPPPPRAAFVLPHSLRPLCPAPHSTGAYSNLLSSARTPKRAARILCHGRDHRDARSGSRSASGKGVASTMPAVPDRAASAAHAFRASENAGVLLADGEAPHFPVHARRRVPRSVFVMDLGSGRRPRSSGEEGRRPAGGSAIDRILYSSTHAAGACHSSQSLVRLARYLGARLSSTSPAA